MTLDVHDYITGTTVCKVSKFLFNKKESNPSNNNRSYDCNTKGK